MESSVYDPTAEVVELCSDLIRIDTSNFGDSSGPGERLAAEHVASLLDEVGIASKIVESERGRASVLARWGGSEGDPLLLHGHLDVVPARAADWQVDPFSGEVKDEYVWGRGAVDMKDFDAILLSTVRARAQAGVVPSRPLVLCFTADEEAGGDKGAGYLAREHREWFEGATAAVGEVGGFSASVAGRRMYLIQAAEKGMAWLRLTADGVAGHGSMRHPDNPVTRLAGAVERIGRHTWPIHLTPTMEIFLAALGDLAGVEATPDNADELVQMMGPASRMLGAVIRNTANPTRLEAGYKVNVIPSQALAWIDGRFLPNQEEDFLATLRSLVGPGISIEAETLLPAVENPYEGRVADAITAALLAEDPEALVVPYLMSGGTDGKYWADMGMQVFGFAPLQLPPDLDFTSLFHGVDERVPVDALKFGARVFDRFLSSV
ncbi:MAG TPA: M20/M25/M40 family metallo-hydrolase [Marmoricola sp.]|nr:M20/M25/M40 family metallo-hydrolase [Marmoricola sp.]